MSIFKNITENYCKKILESYRSKADDKIYKGQEAPLLIQRNECAFNLINSIKEIDVVDSDYDAYFAQISTHINATLKEVAQYVLEYNTTHKTNYTTDLYESFFSSGLTKYINALDDVVKKSPSIIINMEDESLFRNSKEAPWFYQFSFVLYDYILQKEFEIDIGLIERDIFNAKKELILTFIQNAAALHSRFEDENDNEYRSFMRILLQNMSSEEQKIQQRTPEASSASTVYSLFSKAMYSTSEKLLGKSLLGQKIDTLIAEFDERANQPHIVQLD